VAKSPPKPSPIRVPSNPRVAQFTERFPLLADFGGFLHNHPSGDPSPSAADVEMTRQVVEAARPLRVVVHDHLVVGREGVASLKALGLF
jgi:hypothetical protein